MKKQKKNINSKIKLIIFDFDGVIIDSKKNMELSWKNVQERTGTKIKFKNYFSKIGIPFFEILKKIKFDKDYKLAKKIYEETSMNYFNKIKTFPNVRSILKKLSKNYILCLVTSKSKKRTKKLLSKFNLKFDHTFTPDDKFKSKPDPEVVDYLMKNYIIKKNEILMIGDSLADKKFAVRSNIKFIFASYGYFRLKSKFKIKKLSELLKYV